MFWGQFFSWNRSCQGLPADITIFCQHVSKAWAKNVNNRTFYFLQTWYPRYQRNHLSLSVLCLKLFLHKYVKSRVTSGSKFIFQIFYVVVKRLYRLVTRHFDNASWVIWYFPWAAEITEDYRRGGRCDFNRRSFVCIIIKPSFNWNFIAFYGCVAFPSVILHMAIQ